MSGARVCLGATVLLVCVGAGSAVVEPSGLRMHAEGPEPAHTGGFGEPTCHACHTGYPVNEPGGALSVEGLPESWVAGRQYELTVVLRSEEMGAAGFQLSIRDPDGRAAGALAPIDGTVSLDSLMVEGRPRVIYVGHRREGSRVTDPDRVSWRVRWTAPSDPTDVWVHAAANSANGDDSPLGDLVYTLQFRRRRADAPE